MAEASSRAFFHLPFYHCELNLIELFWADMKMYIARTNVSFPIDELRNLFVKLAQKITSEEWDKCVAHIIMKVKPQMWFLDGVVDCLVESMIINF